MAVSETADLKRRVMAAVGWAAVTKFAGQALNWVITLIVIRILTPEDYGLMALTMVFMGFFYALTEAGFADAIVQSDDIGEEALRSLFGFVLAANLGLFIALGLAAYPIAWFYKEPRLVLLLQVSGLSFLLLAFCTIPQAKLMKALDLKRLARVDLVSNLIGGVAVLSSALAGGGVWALLGGMLVTTAARTGLLATMAPYFPRPRFAVRGMGAIFAFGATRTVEQVVSFFYNSADVMIIGRLLGREAVGIYSVAFHIATLPLTKLAGIIKPVAFPAFSLVQGRRDEAFAYLLKAVRLLSLMSFPVFFGLSAIAPEFVHVVLGANWIEATIPLQLIAAVMALRLPALTVPSFLQGLGHARASLSNTLLGAVIFPLAFVIGSRWGMVGVAVAWVVAYPLFFVRLIWQACRIVDASAAKIFETLLLPAAAATIMYAIVALARQSLAIGFDDAARLPLLVGIGGLSYGLVFAMFGRARLREAVSLVRR
jgi:O-antigen/teichoic acid export membrane protein